MIHVLKIQPRFLVDIVAKRKTFELRKNDRRYTVGDIIHFRAYEKGGYTGLELFCVITYILKDKIEYGLLPGYCILGIK